MVLVQFDINGVEPSQSRYGPVRSEALENAWKSFGAKHVEAMSPKDTVITFDKNNGLARAVHKAFYDHHPLRLILYG